MPLQIDPLSVHPQGEVLDPRPATTTAAVPDRPLAVDTHGRRFHVERDPHASVTPLGQLVFFSQFLATAGLFRDCGPTGVQGRGVPHTAPPRTGYGSDSDAQFQTAVPNSIAFPPSTAEPAGNEIHGQSQRRRRHSGRCRRAR